MSRHVHIGTQTSQWKADRDKVFRAVLIFLNLKYTMLSTAAHQIDMMCFLLQGKFIRINFDVNGYIVGANIETCILLNV